MEEALKYQNLEIEIKVERCTVLPEDQTATDEDKLDFKYPSDGCRASLYPGVDMPGQKSENMAMDTSSEDYIQNPETMLKQTLTVDENALELQPETSAYDNIGKVYENGKINTVNCNICGKTFKNRANVKKHIKLVHDEDQAVECKECLKSFKSILYLRSHVRSVHAETDPVPCPVCHKVFLNKKKLNDHTYYAHKQPEEQVTCHVCNKTFKGPLNLKVHLKNVHPAGERHACPFCYKTFKVDMLLQRHLKWAHPNDGMVYKCLECNKVLASLDGYKNHMKSVHHFSAATCDLCGRTFKTKNSLERHLANVHGGGRDAPVPPFVPRDHKCQFCERTFVNSTSLFWHIERFHARDQRPPDKLCVICDKQLSDYAALHRHLTAVHSIETASCKLCGKEFKSAVNLQNHIRITHAPPEATQTCPVCQKTFKCALHLRMHASTVHDGGRYPCERCPKVFASAKYLAKHRKSHEAAREHRCPDCHKAYKSVHAVNKHRKLVHGRTKCALCHIKQADIDEHMRSAHPAAAPPPPAAPTGTGLRQPEVTPEHCEQNVTSRKIKVELVEEVPCERCHAAVEGADYSEHEQHCAAPPMLEVTIKTEIKQELCDGDT